jgi:hypothetical protein
LQPRRVPGKSLELFFVQSDRFDVHGKNIYRSFNARTIHFTQLPVKPSRGDAITTIKMVLIVVIYAIMYYNISYNKQPRIII